MFNQIQKERIRNYVIAHPGCDISDIEQGLGVLILNRMTQEQFEQECVGVIIEKVDAKYYAM